MRVSRSRHGDQSAIAVSACTSSAIFVLPETPSERRGRMLDQVVDEAERRLAEHRAEHGQARGVDSRPRIRNGTQTTRRS